MSPSALKPPKVIEFTPARNPLFDFDQSPAPGLFQPRIAPAPMGVIRSRGKRSIPINMRGALVISTVLHLCLPVVIMALSLILSLWDIELPHKAPKKTEDLVFVLTRPEQPEQSPINPQTRNRAEKNMRAGGVHDPRRAPAVHPPAKPAKPKPAVTPVATAPPPVPVPPINPVPQPPPQVPQKIKPIPVVQPAKPVITVPEKIAATPVDKPSSTNQPQVPSTEFASPATSPNGSALASLPSNGGPGNKTGPVGVDAVKEPDFGPYMKELQRRIKDIWQPPRGNESKRVVVVFRVGRRGNLKLVQVSKSSGEPTADQAAILAIKHVFPFKPLPADYAEEDIDIEFTFDYNVFEKDRFKGERWNPS